MLPAFGWQAVLTHWEFAPAVTVAVAAAGGLYLWGVGRVGRRHPARPWPWWRTALFTAGLVVVAVATQSGIGVYDDVLFWDHMIQHLMLLMVAPPLLVAGQPVTLLLHASRNPVHTWAKRAVRSRVASFLTWPPFGLVAYLATIVSTHLTGLTQQILANQALHNAEHVLYLAAGYLFFLPLLGREPIRWRMAYPVRILVLALAMPVDTFTGLVLGYANSGEVAPGTVRPAGSPGPVADVHWAGAVMWIGGDALMLAFIMLIFWMWSTDDRAVSPVNSWLEAARAANFEDLVGRGATPAVTSPAGSTGPAGRISAAGGTGNAARPGNAMAADHPVAPGNAMNGGGPGASAARARQARDGIDDDEHLAAYNAYLARLNSAPARGGNPPG